MKNKKKLSEDASSGATSSGSIASVSSGLNYSLLKRIPPSQFFGYKEYKMKNKE